VDAEWPDRNSVPRRRPGSAGVELDDNLAVYDDVGQHLILLNAGAAAVWERCDGTTSFRDLVAGLTRAHSGESPSAIEEDVWRTVRQLAEMGLVDDAGEDSTPG
jgi:hypothetical protein